MRKNYRKKIITLFIFAILFLNISCFNKKEETIVFDSSYPLALSPDVSWAVVNDPYVAYKEDVDWNSKITGHSRKGEILQVLGTSKDSDNQTWYKFDLGWLPSSCLTVYSNRYKAQSVSNSMKEK